MTPPIETLQRKKKANFRPSKLSRRDVFGAHKFKDGKLVGRQGGMVASREGEECPVFKDTVPEKALTIVGPLDLFDEIEYWLEYIKGKDCITRHHVQDGYIALRAEHQLKAPITPREHCSHRKSIPDRTSRNTWNQVNTS